MNGSFYETECQCVYSNHFVVLNIEKKEAKQIYIKITTSKEITLEKENANYMCLFETHVCIICFVRYFCSFLFPSFELHISYSSFVILSNQFDKHYIILYLRFYCKCTHFKYRYSVQV